VLLAELIKKELLAFGNANFPLKVLALSPWILLPVYAEMSRYPLKECSYINLEIFRRYEAQLRPYSAYLIGVFKELQNDADGYIESMNTFRKGRAVRTRLKIEIHTYLRPPYLGLIPTIIAHTVI
jgi:hypothetical protein